MIAPSRTLTAARAWLPGAAAPVAALCPACHVDRLVYSAGDTYICCLDCGWQRRLHPGAEALDAALAAGGCRGWNPLLTGLAARPADPLPPVPALLWQQVGPQIWAGPSRRRPGIEYLVTRYPSGHVHCSCPHLGRGCWHRTRAAELGCVETPVPADLWPD